LREHIDRELSDAARPVSADELRAVLGRLGDARQWIDEDRLVWWRKVLLRARRGPNDWRLAYLSLGLLAAGLLLMDRGGTFLVLVGASFLVSRAALAGGRRLQPGEKWLVYPSLILVCAILGGLVMVAPPAGAGAGAFVLTEQAEPGAVRELAEMFGHPSHRPQMSPGAPGHGFGEPRFSDVMCAYVGISTGVAAAGLWWGVLSIALLFARVRAAAKAVFRPFLDGLSRKHAGILAGVSILLMLVGSAVAIGVIVLSQ